MPPADVFNGSVQESAAGTESPLSDQGVQGGSLQARWLLPAPLPNVAFSELGSAAVLEALSVANRADVLSAAAAFRGHVRRAARCPYAHVVLEQFLYRLGTEDSAFLVDELRGDDGALLALEGPGSSVLCQLLRFAAGSPVTEELVTCALAADATTLCHHKFGHKVALAVLEHGRGRHRGAVAAALCGGASRSARHRFAAQVVAEALLQCDVASSLALANAVVGRGSTIVGLACHCFGVQVVRALLQNSMTSPAVLQELHRSQKKLAKDKFGADLLAELGIVSPSGLPVSFTLAAGGA